MPDPINVNQLPPDIQPLNTPQPQPQPSNNPYIDTFFEPLNTMPQAGDLITFVYNKSIGPMRGQIHDREPLLLVLARKKSSPDRFQGINIHYLTNNNVSTIIEMAHKKIITSYDQMKSINVMWANFFRSYLLAWVKSGSVKKINKESIQMEAEIVRQQGLRNLETIREMVKKSLQEKTQQQASQMTENQPLTSTAPIPGTPTVPAIGASAKTNNLNI